MKTPSATKENTTGRKPSYNKCTLTRVCDKSGKLLGYSAEPEKLYEYGNLGLPKTNYQVTCDESTGIWACTCPSTKPCKHIRAAQELNEIRCGVAKVEAEVVAPVAEKPARKVRTYTYDVPATVEAMVALRAEFEKTRSTAKREAIAAVFVGMADSHGDIEIEASRWHFDGEIGAIFEIVQIAPNLSEECSVSAPEVSEECSQEHRDDYREWHQNLEDEPLTEEEATLLEQVGNEPIVLADEIKVEQEWTEPARVIARVHECLRELSYVCDGARQEDGMGFNGCDAAFGHELAARRELSPKQVLAAAKMLRKYNNSQLGGRVPTVKAVEIALTPKAPSALPQAPKFVGNLNGSNRGFNLLATRR